MPHRGRKSFLKKSKNHNLEENIKVEEKNIEDEDEKPTKRAKIIVRNLPFKNTTEKTLEDLFQEYGQIDEVKLLRKEDGKLVGCGFVQFRKVSSAAKAIHCANQKEVNGRKIILDWAIPKDKYLEQTKKLREQNNSFQVKKEILSDEECDTSTKFYIDKKPETRPINNAVKYQSWGAENNENEDDDDDDYSDEEEKKEEDDDDDYDQEQCNDSDISENELNQDKFKYKINEKPATNLSSDAEDGRTVFIRNVPFSATNDDLRECVEKYGPVEYALICIDKLTEHSKGTAFVKFKEKESAVQCLKDSMKLELLENPLTITFALTKENLENKKSNKKTVKDSRNLYLIREGVIIAGSKAAVGVSAADMTKRLQLEQWKSQILKNLNMFVSKTRLVIHNLPPNYDDMKLKQLFKKYSNPKAIIKEAKVMWEKKKVDVKGKPVSKEVGFVSFTNHEDALTALRNINNNPNIFTSKKRPIVAFSIENKAVINTKQKRIEKSRAKLGITVDDKMSKLNRKQRRFIKRRQKIIEKKREAKKLKKSEHSESETEVKSKGIKRKIKDYADKESKKPKLDPNNTVNQEVDSKSFAGISSVPGKKTKLRSRFNLKKQANIHNETLKKNRRAKRQKERKKMEHIRQPKQKQNKKKLLDDVKLSKLIMKHRESVQNSTPLKKWYDN